MPGPIRVLHVDDPDFAALAARLLEREDDRITVHTATDASEALEYLGTINVGCIVPDYDMPRQNGVGFSQTIRQENPDLPFILFTGKGGEDIASDVILAEVTDHFQKEAGPSQYKVLTNRVTNVVEQLQPRKRIEETDQKLIQVAETTGVIIYPFNAGWSEPQFINSTSEDHWVRPVSELNTDSEAFVDAINIDHREDAPKVMEELSNGHLSEIEYRVVLGELNFPRIKIQ